MAERRFRVYPNQYGARQAKAARSRLIDQLTQVLQTSPQNLTQADLVAEISKPNSKILGSKKDKTDLLDHLRSGGVQADLSTLVTRGTVDADVVESIKQELASIPVANKSHKTNVSLSTLAPHLYNIAKIVVAIFDGPGVFTSGLKENLKYAQLKKMLEDATSKAMTAKLDRFKGTLIIPTGPEVSRLPGQDATDVQDPVMKICAGCRHESMEEPNSNIEAMQKNLANMAKYTTEFDAWEKDKSLPKPVLAPVIPLLLSCKCALSKCWGNGPASSNCTACKAAMESDTSVYSKQGGTNGTCFIDGAPCSMCGCPCGMKASKNDYVELLGMVQREVMEAMPDQQLVRAQEMQHRQTELIASIGICLNNAFESSLASAELQGVNVDRSQAEQQFYHNTARAVVQMDPTQSAFVQEQMRRIQEIGPPSTSIVHNGQLTNVRATRPVGSGRRSDTNRLEGDEILTEPSVALSRRPDEWGSTFVRQGTDAGWYQGDGDQPANAGNHTIPSDVQFVLGGGRSTRPMGPGMAPSTNPTTQAATTTTNQQAHDAYFGALGQGNTVGTGAPVQPATATATNPNESSAPAPAAAPTAAAAPAPPPQEQQPSVTGVTPPSRSSAVSVAPRPMTRERVYKRSRLIALNQSKSPNTKKLYKAVTKYITNNPDAVDLHINSYADEEEVPNSQQVLDDLTDLISV